MVNFELKVSLPNELLTASVVNKILDHVKEHRKINGKFKDNQFAFELLPPENSANWDDLTFEQKVNKMEIFYTKKIPSFEQFVDRLAWEFASEDFLVELKKSKFLHMAVHNKYYSYKEKGKTKFAGYAGLVGRVLSFVKDNNIYIGWSLCRKTDRYSKNISLYVAYLNAQHQVDLNVVPHNLRKHVKSMIARAERYFKNTVKAEVAVK